MNKRDATQMVVAEMVLHQQFQSCANCLWQSSPETGFKCTKFNAVPPVKVILFSCGEGWEADIPF